MVEFRKWLIAFAVVAVVVAASAPAHAQALPPTAFTCIANAGTPPLVRAEGITELVGDVVLQCSGGTPTVTGAAVPLQNITVFLNTNITSRLVGGSFANGSEAELLIDEPYPASGQNPPTPGPPANSPTQGYCAVGPTGQLGTIPGCGVVGTGGGVGATGPYRTINIFQGEQVAANAVAWLGVPVDAPGTANVRTIRITNVRGNACQLGTSSTLIPTQIVMFISVNGSQQVTINNPQQTVAFIQPGLVTGGTSRTELQCNTLNNSLLGGSGGVTDRPAFLSAQEGFASSFKGRGYATPAANLVGTSLATLQNVPGFAYNTESGFVTAVTGGPATGAPGVADFGTRVMFNFASVGAGTSLFVPNFIPLVVAGSCASNFLSSCVFTGGFAVLVSSTDASGNGGTAFTGTVTIPASPNGASGCTSSASICAADTTAITLTGTTGVAVYEVVTSNPNAIEQLVLPVSAAFVSNTGQNLPGIGTVTAAVQFAPQSTVNTAAGQTTSAGVVAAIPRFCPGPAARNVFAINQCSCNLLFPFVTNQAGFDTGVAIANTSLDPYGTAPQAGTVTLNYYGGTTGGGAAPAAQTSQTLAGGSELVFTLSNGGNLGIAATPGFQGYIIATTRFQYCHAFAFISDLGAQRLAEGYLAIQLDLPTLNRTTQNGENEGH